MTSARTISVRITRHLAMAAGMALLILGLTVTGYGFILKDMRERAEMVYVRSFVTSQAPAVTRDLIAGNVAATKILAEFVMLKERDRDLRLQIVSRRDGTVYDDEAFAADPSGFIRFQTDLSYFGTTYGTLTAAVPGVTLWQVVRDSNLLLVLAGRWACSSSSFSS